MTLKPSAAVLDLGDVAWQGMAVAVAVTGQATRVLAECLLPFVLDTIVRLHATVRSSEISAIACGITLIASDRSAERFADGGIGLIVANGMLQTDPATVSGSSDP